jgi:hypothetical protein
MKSTEFDKERLKKSFPYIIIAILIIIILLMRSCESDPTPGKIIKVNGKKYEVIKHTIDTQYVKTVKTVVKDGSTIYVDKPVYINVPTNVDTVAILKDYFAKYTYKDTLKLDDSLGYIAVSDTISKNKIYKRVWDAHVNKITVKETTIVKELPRIQVYAGLDLGYEYNKTASVGIDLTLKTKKDQMYRVGVGMNSELHPIFQFGMLWKISLRKNK